MEARTEFRGTGISKGLIAMAAVSLTLGLGVTAGIVAKNLGGTTATQSHIVQGQGGPAFENPARRNGMQLGDYAAPAAAKAVGPDDSTKVVRGNRFL